MKAIDLFCGVGGVSVGLFNAGFDVVGVDVEPQPNYPFEFIQKSVFDLDESFFKDADLIHASPPCQGYIYANRKKENYLRLVEPVREILEKTGKPYIIENVEGAPLRKDLFLCGAMFGLRVLRHRIFEIKGFHIPQLKHVKHKGMLATGEYIGVYGGSKGNPRTRKKYGNRNFTFLEQKQAMQIFWSRKDQELFNAIPPKYYEYIGKNFISNQVTLFNSMGA